MYTVQNGDCTIQGPLQVPRKNMFKSMQIPQIFFLTEKDGDKSCICDIIIFFL